MDRIDLIVNVSKVPNELLLDNNKLLNNQHIKAIDLIESAVNRQHKRYNNSIKYNASLSNGDIKKYITLTNESKTLLLTAANKLSLSARSYFKIIKIAQTIADIDCCDMILPEHISEALQYRKQ